MGKRSQLSAFLDFVKVKVSPDHTLSVISSNIPGMGQIPSAAREQFLRAVMDEAVAQKPNIKSLTVKGLGRAFRIEPKPAANA